MAEIKVIYKITYPNGKIYIGKDLTNNPVYFGSVNPSLVSADFSRDELKDFSIRKEIIWEGEDVGDEIVNLKEVELINLYKSNDPAIGYNRWPKFKG
jgi:hypothetical protein